MVDENGFGTAVRSRIISGGAFAATSVAFVFLLWVSIGSPTPLNILVSESALFALVGAAWHAWEGRKTSINQNRLEREATCRLNVLAPASVYLVAFGAGMFLLWESLYVPSPWYFVSLTMCIGLSCAEIIAWPRLASRETWIIMLQLLGAGFLIQLSFVWLNPSSIFSDVLYDALGIQSVVQTGHVPVSLGYFFYFGAFHVLFAIISETLGISPMVYPVICHVLMILAIPSTFLLAKQLVPLRAALLSSLLVEVSIFFFLPVFAVPSIFGASILILACFALLRYQARRSRANWVTFWILSLFVFFSHPVVALVFGAILIVFALAIRLKRETRDRNGSVPPTVSYVVMFIAYLTLIAVNAFTVFIQSLLESGPRIYAARPSVGSVPPGFVVEVVLNTVGFASLLAPATFTLLRWISPGDWKRWFVLGTIAALVSVPALTVFSGRGTYGIQAVRTILFLSIFLVLPASVGIIQLSNGGRKALGSRRIIVLGIVMTIVFLSTTSYLTSSGNRFPSASIPVQTTHTTDSILASRDFLNKIPESTPLSIDPAMAFFLAPERSGVTYPITAYPLDRSSLLSFDIGLVNNSVAIAFSRLYSEESGYEASRLDVFDVSAYVHAYDNGYVQVYLP